MSRENLRSMIEGGICVALSIVLGLLPIWPSMPQGGNISLAILPLLVYALRNGYKQGLLAGAVYAILQFVIGPQYSFHPVSILLDYLVPGTILGFIALGKWQYSLIVVFAGRFISYLLSGVIVFGSYAPEGANPWVYSAGYNASYLIPEMIVIFIVIYALKKWTRLLQK